jgi:hypothetical protein
MLPRRHALDPTVDPSAGVVNVDSRAGGKPMRLGSCIFSRMERHGHHRADARNLHLHRAALDKLRLQPELRRACLLLVEKWLEDAGSPAGKWLRQWRDMLADWPAERMAEVVLDDEAGQTLRQCSPLGPVLTPQERWRLLEEANRALAAEAGLATGHWEQAHTRQR